MSARILVAEDDEKQSRLIRICRKREGNAVQVVADGRVALERVRSARLDLIVLDVFRIPRIESDAPILPLTARTTGEGTCS
ncbi:hypothetical protein AB0G67_34905 [Streptomyces sp. NPDC021056]|uniref:hypothetical protein n=1 Tax=Streptomyces sp. NPDC021056 TaxID=3155012 RepID=UPI0033CAE347